MDEATNPDGLISCEATGEVQAIDAGSAQMSVAATKWAKMAAHFPPERFFSGPGQRGSRAARKCAIGLVLTPPARPERLGSKGASQATEMVPLLTATDILRKGARRGTFSTGRQMLVQNSNQQTPKKGDGMIAFIYLDRREV